MEYYMRFRALGVKGRVSFDDYVNNLDTKGNLLMNVELLIMGRAAYKLEGKLEGVFPRYPAEYFCSEPCRPPFLRNWHNHFDNYGNYVPGYCGGISLGNYRDLDNLLEQRIKGEEYPILGFLIKGDFEGLLNFSKDFGFRERQKGYLSKCHLCTDVRKHLLGKGEFAELKPKGFYLHLEEKSSPL